MRWNREELKMRGKLAMKRNWAACIAVTLLMEIISLLFGVGNAGSNASGSSESYHHILGSEFSGILAILASVILVMSFIGLVLRILIENVLRIGGCKFFIQNQSGMQPGVETLLDGFRSGHYTNLALTMFLMNLYIALWSLLFIIPGMVKSYEYMMVPYILAENPGMDRKAAFDISRRMMDGQKMDAFILDLSFIGWTILSAFTCGILSVLYVNPYIEATKAEMYAFNKMKAYQEGYIR